MKTLPYCVMTLKNPIMGCKHELHRCRNGDSSRAASAFVQFAVVINTTVRIFLYVRFKVAALKLLRQMHSMRRGRIREDQAPLEGVSLFLPHFFSPPAAFPRDVAPKPHPWTPGHCLPCTANLLRDLLWEIITWRSIRATSSHLLIRGTQAWVFACCFKGEVLLLLPPGFFSCTCNIICIFQVYVPVKWKEKRLSPNLETNTVSDECTDAMLRVAFTQSHVSA